MKLYALLIELTHLNTSTDKNFLQKLLVCVLWQDFENIFRKENCGFDRVGDI